MSDELCMAEVLADVRGRQLTLGAVLSLLDADVGRRSLKLVRHADTRIDLAAIVRTGFLEAYESIQSRPVFHDCEFVLRFVGELGTRARFVGCSRVLGHRPGVGLCPPGFPCPEIWSGNWTYHLEPMSTFDDLRDRLVIDWGQGARSWVQRKLDKPVLEIRPRGFVADFPGYEDVILSFDELKRIVNQPDANRVWHRTLSAVAGVYLIVDLQTSHQYVGSAHGDRGILGRWECYAATGHGGNARLLELVGTDASRAGSFQFTILRTLPKSMAAREVLEIEAAFKRKLGSRAFGLNAN
ncbi:MAG: GIY-YIG nuclease family protein [Planctomycetota bacterium]